MWFSIHMMFSSIFYFPPPPSLIFSLPLFPPSLPPHSLPSSLLLSSFFTPFPQTLHLLRSLSHQIASGCILNFSTSNWLLHSFHFFFYCILFFLYFLHFNLYIYIFFFHHSVACFIKFIFLPAFQSYFSDLFEFFFTVIIFLFLIFKFEILSLLQSSRKLKSWIGC